MIDSLLYQWNNGKLLYPLGVQIEGYQRPNDWSELVQESEITKLLTEWYVRKLAKKQQVTGQRKKALIRIITTTRWHSLCEVKEEELALLGKAMMKYSDYKKTAKVDIPMLNDLRLLLINSGRNDIKRPRDIAKEKRMKYPQDMPDTETRFGWVDIEKYPKLKEIREKAGTFLIRLKNEGLAVGTINARTSHINNFFRYLIKYYPLSDITIELVDEMFLPQNPNSLVEHFLKTKKRRSAIAEVNAVVTFLVHCELYSVKARKNTPKDKQSTKRFQQYRDAMPKEMVSHIIDIIKNRPPNTTTVWDKDRADSKWWKHDVYPIFPMMMLLGYYIPLRGEQIRNLCRKNSFVFKENGEIDSFVINTDKNVNRKYLQEIPCVWDDLQAFVPFLKWHKQYFKHLPTIEYHDDSNSPWEDIEPLMILPQSLRPMANKTHFDYHKKILCKYQLEKMEEANKRGDKDYPMVAWRRDGKPFFESIEELDSVSSAFMTKIDVSYDIHSLRVTGATRYLESGVGIKTVMDLTGHTSPETLMRVYINLTKEEKVNTLKSAINKIYFGDSENLVSSGKELIKGELADAYDVGEDSIKNTLEDNKLFSLYRKSGAVGTKVELYKGTEIALKKHPSVWRPMIHGICPSVKCPEGRENKCSICPYLITGKLFINGITHQLNALFAIFQRESVEVDIERKKGYDNHAKAESLESILEEIFGWQEILSRVEEDIREEGNKERGITKTELEPFKKKSLSVFGTESLHLELAYLKNAYNAELMGVEKDRFGMKILTIKAMRLAIEMGDKKMFDSIGENESKSIDLLMQYYNGNITYKHDVKNFVTSMNMIPEKVQKI